MKNVNTQINPFDTQEDEKALSAVEAELKQARASLESNFAQYMADKIEEKDEELFFSDKKAFFEMVLKEQNVFLEENINPKIEQANNLKQNISQKKQLGLIDEARKSFEAKYPDANTEELLTFLENEVPKKIRQELEQLEPLAFFEELYKLFLSVKGDQEKDKREDKNLPKDLNGVAGDTGAISQGNNLPFERL